MGPNLEKVIHDISLRMRLLRARQEDNISENLSEREALLLELLSDHGQMTVSQIAAAYPGLSESTISTTISKLWRQKIVSKTINPENQRMTIVELTEKGKEILEVIKKQQAERFNELFHAIEVTEDEKQVFLRVLTRVITYFDQYLGFPSSANTNRQ